MLCFEKLLNISGGWRIFFDYLVKVTFWACLFGSGLNLIFHWRKTHSFIILCLYSSLWQSYECHELQGIGKFCEQTVWQLKINHQVNHLWKSCHTSSKAFEISRQTLPTSRPASNDSYVTCVIDINWLIHESPGSKPEVLSEIKLFSYENLIISLNISFPKIFPQTGKIWRSFFNLCLSPFF